MMTNTFNLILILLVSGCASTSLKPTEAIAAANLQIEGGQTLNALFAKIESAAHDAVQQKADLLLLPELTVFDLLPINPSNEALPSEFDRISRLEKDYRNRLKTIAKSNHLLIVGASGMVKSGAHWINRAYVVFPDGDVKFQDKLYPTPWEKKYGFIGEKNLRTFHYQIRDQDLKFVVLTCHDAEFPAVSQKLAKMQFDLILVPSMTDDVDGQTRVKITSSARAIEHMAYVLMTGDRSVQNAPWHSYVGNNFFFQPANHYFKPLNSMAPTNGVSVWPIDLELLKKSRADPAQVYPARDQRSDVVQF
jgi:predicted amidohydrolase